jgi:hypothetical protein
MSIAYLFDENVDAALVAGLRRFDPGIPVRAVGESAAPPRGTLDPEILLWCEEWAFILVTNNRHSMPIHLRDHLAAGRHMPGVFILNAAMGYGETIEVLQLNAHASEPGEHRDQIKHLSKL